jgi:hypothetical protein
LTAVRRPGRARGWWMELRRAKIEVQTKIAAIEERGGQIKSVLRHGTVVEVGTEDQLLVAKKVWCGFQAANSGRHIRPHIRASHPCRSSSTGRPH